MYIRPLWNDPYYYYYNYCCYISFIVNFSEWPYSRIESDMFSCFSYFSPCAVKACTYRFWGIWSLHTGELELSVWLWALEYTDGYFQWILGVGIVSFSYCDMRSKIYCSIIAGRYCRMPSGWYHPMLCDLQHYNMWREVKSFTFQFFHHKIWFDPGYGHILSPQCIHTASLRKMEIFEIQHFQFNTIVRRFIGIPVKEK